MKIDVFWCLKLLTWAGKLKIRMFCLVVSSTYLALACNHCFSFDRLYPSHTTFSSFTSSSMAYRSYEIDDGFLQQCQWHRWNIWLFYRKIYCSLDPTDCLVRRLSENGKKKEKKKRLHRDIVTFSRQNKSIWFLFYFISVTSPVSVHTRLLIFT